MPTTSAPVVSIAELESPTSEESDCMLPPVDCGKRAWLFLAACTAMEAITIGLAFAFGVFQSYYSAHGLFNNANTAAIGACGTGLIYLGMPVLFALYRYWPQCQQLSCAIGVFIMPLGLALGSLVNSLPALIMCQGILYSIGGVMSYAPCLLLMESWFDKRKGLAYGVMWAGSGVSGVLFPIVLERLLDQLGFRVTLRILAIAIFILTAPLVYFVRPRVPVTSNSENKPYISLRFLLTPTFGLFELCNIIEGFGFFLPSTYLPSHARSIGASSEIGALTVTFFNLATVAGCIVMGILIDRYDFTKCILLSTVGSTLGIFLLWGFSLSLPPLFIFSIVYGLFAGSYSTTWTGVQRDTACEVDTAEPSMILAWMAFGRGIGNVTSGPLSGTLLSHNPLKGRASHAYGSDYGTLIVFTGLTALFGGGGYIARCLKRP